MGTALLRRNCRRWVLRFDSWFRQQEVYALVFAVGHVMSVVIIEVDINGAQIPSPDTRRPSPEGLGRVAAGIGGEAGAMQPNIGGKQS